MRPLLAESLLIQQEFAAVRALGLEDLNTVAAARVLVSQAWAAFDQSIELSPFPYAHRVSRAIINLELGAYEAAQMEAGQLLADLPGHPASNYIQGLLDFQNKDYRSAIKRLSLATQAAAIYPMSPYYLSIAHLLENDEAMAARLARDFFDLAPNDVRGRKLLAVIRLREGNMQEVSVLL